MSARVLPAAGAFCLCRNTRWITDFLMISRTLRFGSALCAAFFVSPVVSGSELRTPVLSNRDAPLATETLALPSAPALFQRIVVLGASVSAGFVISEPLGGPQTPQYRF